MGMEYIERHGEPELPDMWDVAAEVAAHIFGKWERQGKLPRQQKGKGRGIGAGPREHAAAQAKKAGAEAGGG
eukprot:240444-Pelagomonas_calceolata.AAC.1